MLINLDKINKSFGAEMVLKQINFSCARGDLISLIGMSGSGKSTLLNILGLLDVPDSGSYLLQSEEVKFKTAKELSVLRNKFFGFVFQGFFLIKYYTVLDNVSLPLLYRNEDKSIAQDKSMAWLQRLGLADLAHKMPNQLSGGQQQRVAIARALVGQPSIVLADEPTGSLDAYNAALVIDLLLELNVNYGVSIILVTHDNKLAKKCTQQYQVTAGTLLQIEGTSSNVSA